ncbi:hypothetical protein ABH926_001137 [Catenulispora sp. GP43]|uniref:eCIS core domain-containing protein n=1 Tax=Catenulispora sp. GP43 TaxID=3156263 RepID=UPI0035199EF1
MHTPEKLPASKDGKGGGPAKAPRPSVLSPAAAVGGPMTPAAVLTLQRAVGNQVMSGMLGREEHVHGADCGHGSVQRRVAVETENAESPADILKAAMASASRSIESGTLKKAESFYQNNRLSRGRVHTGQLAQRAVAAFGAEAMTVGEHIFFGAGVENDTATAFHEYGHLDKNTRGIAETGTAGASGIPVTDPGQHSEREAENDGAAAAGGAEVAPSVVAQRAAGQGAAAAGGESATVQRTRSSGRRRSNSPRDEEEERSYRHRSRSYDYDYEDARATTSYVPAPSSSGSSPRSDDYYGATDYDRYDANYVTPETMEQNPPGRRAIGQNAVMGRNSARDILTSAGRTPRGTAAHLHTGAAYALGDGLEGQTQRASNLTPGSQATNLDHKRYEDSVPEATEFLGLTVTGAGLTGSGASGRGYDVYDSMDYQVRGPDGRRLIDSHPLDLSDYSSAADRQSRSDYRPTREIREDTRYSAIGHVMDAVHPDDWDPEYRAYEEQRRRRHGRHGRRH